MYWGFTKVSQEQIQDLKYKIAQLSTSTIESRMEQNLLRAAKKEPVDFASLMPDKYAIYLLDGKLEQAYQTFEAIGNGNLQVGGNMKLGPLPDLETESSVREENLRLKAELSVAERELAMVTKPPSWLSLLKEWFMYKVLKRSKPQPLYIGPYR